MKIMQYVGKEPYTDERMRFVAHPLSFVEFTPEEADFRLEKEGDVWQLADMLGPSIKRADRQQRS
ncbi:hypothetical protein GCM10010916_02300 [Paenibacillus abyssi]|uniref:Uncharacterized protein n=1 Tax=Paenibacillus abyssi TaxID=1340531 RepID=A0A917CKH1_9BACL|nr:hypothetical protein GCM10010916_02300 [Paenibacillus abyssi]